jgi:hypothetical protein
MYVQILLFDDAVNQVVARQKASQRMKVDKHISVHRNDAMEWELRNNFKLS